ncbi:hypothetical protein BKA70DRAFT_1230950 [Coprinopsis sp. MPI-PUGE-AT-0042]|nr:hypothetical protein BKA70DRAFT_1230950 [Coprinopsis sp. MPI-PUGE-AT-0042]
MAVDVDANSATYGVAHSKSTNDRFMLEESGWRLEVQTTAWHRIETNDGLGEKVRGSLKTSLVLDLERPLTMRQFKRVKTIQKDVKCFPDENTPQPPTTSSPRPRLQSKTRHPTALLIDLALNIPSSKNDPLSKTVKPETYLSPSKNVEIQEARSAWNDYRTYQLELGMKRFEEVALEWLHLRTAERDQTQSASVLNLEESLQPTFGLRELDQAPLFAIDNGTCNSDDAFEDLWERDHVDTSPCEGSDYPLGNFDDGEEEAWSPLSSSPSSSSSSSPSSPLSPPSPFSFNDDLNDWPRAHSPSNEYSPSPIAKMTPSFGLSRRRHAIDLEFSDEDDDFDNDIESEAGGDDFYLDFPHPDPTASSPCCRHIDPGDLPSFVDIFYCPDAEFNA